MENKTYMMPPIGGKSILRSTGEEVEIIDSYLHNRGTRTEPNPLLHEEGDWVTYIDSEGKEHIKEKLNVQLDFKFQPDNVFSKLLNDDWKKGMPSTRNCRIYELAKELLVKGYMLESAVSEATELVDAVGVDAG